MTLYSEYSKCYPELISCLANARNSGRFAHAFMIVSPFPGVRKDFARILMQIAGCRNSINGKPDTNCRFCSQVENNTYADCHILSPIGKKYQIKVGDRNNPEPNTLRDLLDHLGYTSGNYRKFGIIEDADRMGVEAQNALLKTLEEPPPETTLILLTANPGALLPTTRSRCQILNLPDNDYRFEYPWLEKTIQILNDLCFNCGNDLVKTEICAQSLIDIVKNLSENAEKSIDEEFAALSDAAKRSEDAHFVKQIETRKSDAASGAYIRERRSFLAAITTFCSQIYLIACGADISDIPNPEMFSGITLPEEISPERAAKILKEAEELDYTLHFNVNDELALRTFAVNLAMS